MGHPTEPECSRAAQAARVKALIEKLDWSQKDLAQRTGITEPMISMYLRGIKSITGHNLYRIAKALDVTMDYVYSGSLAGLSPETRNWVMVAQIKRPR